MALDLTKMLPPGSHAWCSEPECGWTNLSQRCHFHGKTHMQLRGHLVHVYEAAPPEGWTPETSACGEPAVTAFGPVSCELPDGHAGRHRGGRADW